MPLQIYNTLTRKKEEFKPIKKDHVGIYVCGPTVYSHSHIGHAKSYISFDTIIRYIRYCGYNVLYVQNITDVGHLLDDGEDRMLKQSKIEKVHPMQIAETITRSYFEDMDKLGVIRPDISPRATGHIIEQIEIVKKLLAIGYAYEVNGSVYYDVRKFKKYGKLSGRVLEESVEGTRVESRSEKRFPADFALWKKAESGHIMHWPSPWGEGFPGWHVECSAMSMKYLGNTFDIHGGGMDNQFPHHECEIAQSEAATGKQFVKYWIHNNLVTVGGQKMSKSLGNFITIKDAFAKYDPMVIRFFILQSHYRSTLDVSDEALNASKVGYERLKNTLRLVNEEIEIQESSKIFGSVKEDFSNYKTEFLKAMDDDFNTPKAIAVLFDLSSKVNDLLSSHLSPDTLKEIVGLYNELGGKVLGIFSNDRVQNEENISIKDYMRLIINIRNEVRNQKLWPLSDMIRDGLKAIGFQLEDKKEGTVWRKKE